MSTLESNQFNNLSHDTRTPGWNTVQPDDTRFGADLGGAHGLWW
jgi:hypothetical protein